MCSIGKLSSISAFETEVDMIAIQELSETAGVFESTLTQLEPILKTFEPVSLQEMTAVSLMDRIDTKYVMGVSQLLEVLERLSGQYCALTILGRQLNLYQTLYFDTRDFDLYHQHHSGFGTRYKVRERKYVGSELTFIEVKHRTNRGRTVKSRLRIPDIRGRIEGDEWEFVDCHIPFEVAGLEPKLWTEYFRITLVSKSRPERVTLDVNLLFRWGERSRTLPGVVIAEVKQAQVSRDSDFIQVMRALGIRPGALSKYCTGVAMLYNVKSNTFKPRLRKVNQVIQKEHGYVAGH